MNGGEDSATHLPTFPVDSPNKCTLQTLLYFHFSLVVTTVEHVAAVLNILVNTVYLVDGGPCILYQFELLEPPL